VVLPRGCAVLNAADPLVLQMAPLSPGAVALFALDASHPAIVEHRARQQRAAFVRDGAIVLAEGEAETTLLQIAAIPATHGGRVGFQVENALAAAAAGWWLKVPFERLCEVLEAFGAASSDGRFEFFQRAGGPAVVVDDCHNTSALAALGEALSGFSQGRRTAVYSAGARRRDADLVRQGEQLAALFDRVVLYDDASAFDRPPGEVRALLRQGLAKGGRVREVTEIHDHRQAIEEALAAAGPDELVVVQSEDSGVGPAVSAVREWWAKGEEPGGRAVAARPVARLVG
jgi:cyanophycin synthetase